MLDSLFSEMDLDPEMMELEKRMENRKKEENDTPAAASEGTPSVAFDKKLYILDGYSIIYRSYFAHITSPILDKEGRNVSAYFGFFSTLFAIMSNYKMDYLAVTMDEKAPTFRHDMYPEYKANREKAPEDLHAQVPLIIESLGKMGIQVLSKPGFEADDVIASLTKRAKERGIESIMVTGDKDLCQLVDDHVFALRPPKKGESKYHLFGRGEVKEAYGVEPSQIVDYLSIIGDASDNVPGIKGLGEKGAVKLLTEYVSFDGIYRHLDSLSPSVRRKLVEGRESGELSRKLIKLSFDALEDDFDFASHSVENIDKAAIASDLEARGFKMLSKRALKGEQGREEEQEEENQSAEASPLLSESEKNALCGFGSYSEISGTRELSRLLKEIAEFHDGFLSFELLTQGYELSSPSVAFAFSFEPKKAYFVSLKDERDEKIALLREYLESGRLNIVAQDSKFLLKHLAKEDIGRCNIAFDTMLAGWLIDSNANVYSLEDLASRFFSETLMNISDIRGKDESLYDVSSDLLSRYLCERADYVFRLQRILERRLHEKNQMEVFRTIELPLVGILAEMEMAGIYLSEERMSSIQSNMDKRLDELILNIHSLAGYQFNINSTMQLGKVLFEDRGLPAGKRTQRGFSTDTATLEGLRATGDPIISLILEYRQLAKLKSTYVDVLPSLTDGQGRIHTTFLQTGTATGRLSSRNPNLQNIPVRTDEGRLIRSAFVPKHGAIFMSADYSQIELVVLAHMTDDPGLTEAFRQGIDVHKYTASLIFSKDVGSVTPAERRMAKTINFGIMYGMSSFRLAGELGISRGEASEFIKTYFDRYSGVKRFVDKTTKDAESQGFVKTKFGHSRDIIGINSRNKTEKAAAERVAVNTVIQGTAAEIMKKAMIEINRRIKEEKLASRLLLQVHDELIFEVPESEKVQMESLVRDAMENAVTLSVPLRTSIETAHSWGDMH